MDATHPDSLLHSWCHALLRLATETRRVRSVAARGEQLTRDLDAAIDREELEAFGVQVQVARGSWMEALVRCNALWDDTRPILPKLPDEIRTHLGSLLAEGLSPLLAVAEEAWASIAESTLAKDAAQGILAGDISELLDWVGMHGDAPDERDALTRVLTRPSRGSGWRQRLRLEMAALDSQVPLVKTRKWMKRAVSGTLGDWERRGRPAASRTRRTDGEVEEILATVDQSQRLAVLLQDAGLTERQRELVLLIRGAGLTSTEAAARLGIAPSTARRHLQAARKKLGDAAAS